MTSGKSGPLYIGFSGFLLLIVNNIRSGVLVDTTFLPRFFLLTCLLLVITWLLFRKKIILANPVVGVAFLLLYLWSLLSSTWSIVPSEAIVQSQLLFVAFSVFLVTGILSARNVRFERIFILFTLLALLFSFGLALFRMSTLEFFDPYRIISVSANNNLYAGLLLISLPLALAGYSIFSGFVKYLSLAVATSAVFFIIVVQSRAAYLGLFFAFLLLLIMLAVRYSYLLTKTNWLTGSFALVLLSLAVVAFYTSLDGPRKQYFLSKVPVWQYFQSYDSSVTEAREKKSKEKAALTGIAEFDFAGSYYENANLRMIFWKKSACLIAANPILGVGAGNWRINVAACPKPPNPDHIFKNYTYSQPHNEWIGIAAELGIPGLLLAMIVFIFPVIIVFYKILIRKQEITFEAMLYASFIAGFYLYACFDFPFKRIEHTVIFSSLFAFLLYKVPVMNIPSKIRGKLVQRVGLMVRGFWSWKYLRFLLTGGLIFTCLVLVSRIRGEYFTLQMFRNGGKDHALVIQYGREAGSIWYKLTPNTLPLDWFIGVAQFRMGDHKGALGSFEKALAFTPFEVRVMNDHATALYQTGMISAGAAGLRKTLTIDPFFDDARFNLAAIFFYHGKRDSAKILVEGCRDSQKKKDFLDEMK